jgi:anti-sigma factor RsiW
MSCRENRSAIALLVGGELPGDERRQLEAHLERCPVCRAFANELGGTHALVRELGAAAIDTTLANEVRVKVMASVRARQRRVAPRLGWLWWSAVGATVLGGVALIVVDGGRGRTTTQARVQPQAPTVAPEPTRQPAQTVGRVQTAAVQPNTAAAQESAPTPHQPSRARASQPRAGRVPALSNQRELAVVKLVTDDPDVVIYCIVDEEKG